MNASSKHPPDGTSVPRRYRPWQAPMALWLMFVWVALWGDISVANVVGGLLVGAAASFVFPLPPLRLRLKVRPLRLTWLILHFLGSVVVASFQVSVLTLSPRRLPRNAVIEVDLRTSSDFVLTVVAEMTSLIPGSIVVEARRSTYSLFLHVLGAGDAAGAEKMRVQTLALERRVVRAMGAEIDHLDAPGPRSARLEIE